MKHLREFKDKVLPLKNKLYRFAAHLTGDAEDAKDIVQEVFMKVWDQRDKLPEFKNIEAWCMTMTKNKCLDRVRSGHFKISRKTEEEDVSDHNSFEKKLELNDTMKQIHGLIQLLPAKQKEVLLLRDIEGYSYEEITEILKIDLNQVKVNLHRARKFITTKITELEIYGTGKA